MESSMPDEFDTLRHLRSEVNQLSPEVVTATLERARARFDRAATADGNMRAFNGPARPGPARRRRSRPLITTATVLVAVSALVGTGIGVVHLVAPESAAAATLHDAAHAVSASSPMTGAYTRVTTKERSLGYASSDGGKHYDEGYLSLGTEIVWVPRDLSGTWVRKYWSEPATTFYGGAAARKMAADDYASEAHEDDPGWQRAAAGDFTNGELGGTPAGTLTISDLVHLPRETQELVRRLEAAPRAADATDSEQVFDTISQFLRTGVVPADLRVSMYNALATLPDIVITQQQASLDGRVGTAIGLADPSGNQRTDVILSPTTGDYLGQRMVQLKRNGSIPAGALLDSTSVVSVAVDRRP